MLTMDTSGRSQMWRSGDSFIELLLSLHLCRLSGSSCQSVLSAGFAARQLPSWGVQLHPLAKGHPNGVVGSLHPHPQRNPPRRGAEWENLLSDYLAATWQLYTWPRGGARAVVLNLWLVTHFWVTYQITQTSDIYLYYNS